MTVGEIILEQLGGRMFLIMTGGTPSLIESGLSVRLKQTMTKDRISHMEVRLNASDLYDVKFLRVRAGKTTEVHSIDGLYAEDLRSTFETHTGLYASV